MDSSDRDSLILAYFELGLSYADIVYILLHEHHVNLSERQLKRLLRRMHLKRREYDNIEHVVEFIQRELRSSGCLHGYRVMYIKCKRSGYRVRMEHVRFILQLLDPQGVRIRRCRRLQRRAYFAKGPNYIWHLDGYDKLKPFGLCISGCICGFSRNIVWLNVYHTNSNPKIIAGYFLDAVRGEKGCPKIVRGDRGTENVVIKNLQFFLRRNHADNMVHNAFIEGASSSNQRIECWWGFLRRQSAQFWIELFRGLEEVGDFNGSFIDKSLVQFCFMALIQNELDMVADMWNEHTIRPSRNQHVPSGRPSMMYLTPSLWGVENQICFVPNNEIDICCMEAEFRSTIPCDEAVYDVCVEILRRDGLTVSANVEDALDLYLHLRRELRTLI